MIEFTPEIIRQIIDTGPCIECDATYFHKPLCQKGYGLSATELIKRIQARAKLLPKPVEFSHQCDSCGKPATGTAWVAYHGLIAVITAVPSCERCADTIAWNDRPYGFLPGIITKDTNKVQAILREVA